MKSVQVFVPKELTAFPILIPFLVVGRKLRETLFKYLKCARKFPWWKEAVKARFLHFRWQSSVFYSIKQVCLDVPLIGRKCDGLDLTTCQDVVLYDLNCQQVIQHRQSWYFKPNFQVSSFEECQALKAKGMDCHPVVQGDNLRIRRMVGQLHAFEICEDFPSGEVCQEEEVEVCQPSINAVEKTCREDEVWTFSWSCLHWSRARWRSAWWRWLRSATLAPFVDIFQLFHWWRFARMCQVTNDYITWNNLKIGGFLLSLLN